MDLDLAIARNRESLLQIVASLFAMIGLADGGSVERLARPLHRAVLALLRPAEAAVRRLIVVAARGLTVRPPAVRRGPVTIAGPGKGPGRATFRLFDPRRRFGRQRFRGRRPEPRIHVIDAGFDPRIFAGGRDRRGSSEPEVPAGVNALPLCRRLIAIKAALDDLPRQARRYARWRARPLETRRPRLMSALRPGAPPGFRKDVPHRVHAILHECHWLAREGLQPDSS